MRGMNTKKERNAMTDTIRLEEDQLVALLAAILCAGNNELHPRQSVDSARMILEAANEMPD